MVLETILNLASKIMQDLGTGHREAIYTKALVVSLNEEGVRHRHEVDIPIMYLGQCIGHGRADLIVEDMVVEIKAVCRPPKEAMGQLQKYVNNLSLVEKKKFRGVILNFCQQNGEVSAYLYQAPEKESRNRARVELAEEKGLGVKSPITKSRFFVNKK